MLSKGRGECKSFHAVMSSELEALFSGKVYEAQKDTIIKSIDSCSRAVVVITEEREGQQFTVFRGYISG
jgi:hypothetical protein